MIRSLHILIVIPVYNHGSTLRSVVEKALATGYQVLVVDDGSDDDCLKTITDLQCLHLRSAKNRGKGAALLRGAREADELGFDTIVTIDADGQHDPADIKQLVKKAQTSQEPSLIIGARQMIQQTVPQSSHFGKSFSNFWVRLECGLELEDTQSGFRLYPVKELLSLPLTRTRYDFEIESIVKLAWSGIVIDSASISVHYPTADKRISHFHKIKDNIRLSILHSQLIFRRLMPWPHKKLNNEVPIQKKVGKTLRQNPFKVLRQMCVEHSSPLWLAMAVWIGIFLGALPLLAVHTVAIIYFSHRLHLNKVAAVAASQFCMPPVVPAICIQAGYYFRNGEFLLDLSWQRWLLEIHERLWEWLLGSLVVGPVLAFIMAALMYWMSSRVQEKPRLKGQLHQ